MGICVPIIPGIRSIRSPGAGATDVVNHGVGRSQTGVLIKSSQRS